MEKSLEGKQWLVGDKFTFADLSFAPWNDRVDQILQVKREDMFNGFPNVKAWHERATSRPAWIKLMKKRAELMDAQGLQWNGIPKGIETFEEYKKVIEQTHAKR